MADYSVILANLKKNFKQRIESLSLSISDDEIATILNDALGKGFTPIKPKVNGTRISEAMGKQINLALNQAMAEVFTNLGSTPIALGKINSSTVVSLQNKVAQALELTHSHYMRAIDDAYRKSAAPQANVILPPNIAPLVPAPAEGAPPRSPISATPPTPVTQPSIPVAPILPPTPVQPTTLKTTPIIEEPINLSIIPTKPQIIEDYQTWVEREKLDLIKNGKILDEAKKASLNVVRDYNNLPPVEPNTTRVYHGTLAENLPSISQEGILSQKELANRGMLPPEIKAPYPVVFATPKPQGTPEEPKIHGDAVTIADVANKLVRGQEALSTITLKNIPPENIKGVYVPPYKTPEGGIRPSDVGLETNDWEGLEKLSEQWQAEYKAVQEAILKAQQATHQVPETQPTTPVTEPQVVEDYKTWVSREKIDLLKNSKAIEDIKKQGANVVRNPTELPPVEEGKTRVFHGTNISNVPSILQHGVLSSGELAQKGLIPPTENPQQIVNAATNPNDAQYGNVQVIADIPTEQLKGQNIKNILELDRIAAENIKAINIPLATSINGPQDVGLAEGDWDGLKKLSDQWHAEYEAVQKSLQQAQQIKQTIPTGNVTPLPATTTPPIAAAPPAIPPVPPAPPAPPELPPPPNLPPESGDSKKYSAYITQLRERLLREVEGLSGALTNTQIDALINRSINQGFVAKRPQIDNTRLSRSMGEQISTILNEEISKTLNTVGTTPINLGKIGVSQLQTSIETAIQTSINAAVTGAAKTITATPPVSTTISKPVVTPPVEDNETINRLMASTNKSVQLAAKLGVNPNIPNLGVFPTETKMPRALAAPTERQQLIAGITDATSVRIPSGNVVIKDLSELQKFLLQLTGSINGIVSADNVLKEQIITAKRNISSLPLDAELRNAQLSSGAGGRVTVGGTLPGGTGEERLRSSKELTAEEKQQQLLLDYVRKQEQAITAELEKQARIKAGYAEANREQVRLLEKAVAAGGSGGGSGGNGWAGMPPPPGQQWPPQSSAQYERDWQAAIMQDRAFNFQQRYPQVWQRLKMQDELNRTRYARPENITGISAETNRNVGYVTSRYFDEQTGMSMSTKAFFNPQTGQILTDYSSRFASLTDRIARNTKEFIGWTAAVTLVYLPMQKLGQLMQETIDQEARLADVAIVMQMSQAGVNKVFFEAADIARRTGESLTGVIEGYAQAAQATAGYADEGERANATAKLLTDSITLAKMSGMSQAEATDTLVAALNQMNMTMNQGTELLDKWQATARAANVPVATLASTFAIVGAAAQDAGLSMEQLNAITAVVAAAQITSAKETGNAIRGIVSGYTTTGAQNVLREFGISVRDTEGNMRGLLDVYSQLSAMIQSGAINPSQQNRIAMGLTGGNRGMSRVTSLLLGMGNINQIVAAQENPQGQAQRAIQFELETTQAKVTNLGTAFSELARTLGTEGNLLPTFKAIVVGLTSMIDLFTKVSSAMGSSTLTALALAVAFKSLFSVGGQNNMVATVASLSGNLAYMRSRLTGGTVIQAYERQDQAMQRVMNAPPIGAYSRTAWGTGAVAGIAGFGIPALMNLAGGNQQAAIANAAGGIAGGILGILGGPAGIAAGATIGSVIGEVFVTTSKNMFGGAGATNIAPFIVTSFSDDAKKAAEIAKKSADDIAKKDAEKLSKEETYQKGLQALRDKIPLNERTTLALAQAASGTNTVAGTTFSAPTQTKLEEQLSIMAAQKFPTEYALLIANYLKASSSAGGMAPVTVNSPFVLQSQKISEELSESISQAAVNARRNLQEEYYSPTRGISRAEYLRRTGMIETGASGISNIFTALYKGTGAIGDISNYNFDKLGAGITTWADATKYATDVLTKLPAEQLDEINAITAEITDLETKINDAKNLGIPNPTIKIGEENVSLAEAQTRLSTLYTNFPEELKTRDIQRRIASARPPQISNLEFPNMSVLDAAIQATRKEMKNVLESMTDESERTAQEMAWNLEKAVVTVGDSWRQIEGLPADMLGKNLDEVIAKMENFQPNLQVREVGATTAQWNQALKQYPAMLERMQKEFGPMGWKPNIEGAIVKLDENQSLANLRFWKGELSIMEMLLGDIKKNTEPTGIYNLPEGAEFYVPWQAAAMDFNSRQQMANNNTGVNTVNVEPTGAAPANPNITPQEPLNRNLTEKLIQKSIVDQINKGNNFETGAPESVSRLVDSNNQLIQSLNNLGNIISGKGITYQENPELYKPYGQEILPNTKTDTIVPITETPTTPLDSFSKFVDNLNSSILSLLQPQIPDNKTPTIITPTTTIPSYEKNPELFKTYGQTSAPAAINIPPINTTLNLTSNTNVTLMIDANVLAQVMSKQMGSTLATSGPAYGTTQNIFGP